jgi:phage FluMu protein Com
MSVRTYVTDDKCPHCDRNILEEITAHVYQEGGKDFQFQCPRCENMLDIEINPVPSFSIAKVEAAQQMREPDESHVAPNPANFFLDQVD